MGGWLGVVLIKLKANLSSTMSIWLLGSIQTNNFLDLWLFMNRNNSEEGNYENATVILKKVEKANFIILTWAVGVPGGRRSGGPLATTLVATTNIIFFLSPSQPFLIEGVLGSKNIFSEIWPEHPKIFPNPVGHFSGPKQPSWILQVVRVSGGERVPLLPLGW